MCSVCRRASIIGLEEIFLGFWGIVLREVVETDLLQIENDSGPAVRFECGGLGGGDFGEMDGVCGEVENPNGALSFVCKYLPSTCHAAVPQSGLSLLRCDICLTTRSGHPPQRPRSIPSDRPVRDGLGVDRLR